MVNPVSRILHDVGLAAWFGGTLSNAVAFNAAAAETTSRADAGAVANAGWNRWTPVNAAAIGAHLVGSVGQLAGNRHRLAAQKGVGTMSIVKTATTAAALGATAYARVLGKKVDTHRRRAGRRRHHPELRARRRRLPRRSPSWPPCSGPSRR